jgi:hypothetical protein
MKGRKDLGDLLNKPTENEADPAILDPDIDNAKLDPRLRANRWLFLEVSRLEFYVKLGGHEYSTSGVAEGSWVDNSVYLMT